jgi:hypothetical protein
MATKKQTLSGEPLKDLGDDQAAEVTEGAEAVKEAAEAKKPENIDQGVQQNALDWFIGSEPIGGEGGDLTTVRLNVGNEDNPKWIEWKLRPIELDQLRGIRKRAANTREARRTGNVDEFRVNLEIVVCATAEPDLAQAAEELHKQGRGPLDPVEALRLRFHSRPGFITQLAGKILTASGFDEEDVQDATQVAAAGN